MKITLREISKKIVLVSTAFVLAVSSLLAVLPFLVSETAYAAGETVTISTVAELCDAIDNQADGQTWTIQAGTYDLGVCNSITAGGQTGWYFPITANDLTINGGGATIYGTGYTANGAWHTQDFVAIFGNKVTLSNLTLMSKIYANKVIEVMGDNSTIDNVIVRPNTAVDSSVYDNIADLDLRAWQKEWSGSILYNNTTSAHTLNNVTIYNGGISGSYAPGVTLNMTNVTLDYATNDDWTNSYGVYSSQPWTINGVPHLLYHVNSTLDNIESVMTAVNDSALVGAKTISLDSDIVTNKQITITQPVTFDGNSHTVSPSFPRTDNSNNAAIGIQADNVTLSNLIVDGTSGTNLHGINVFAAANVQFNAVTSKNNDRSGIVNNGSALTVTDVTTAGNGWHGINVDQGSAPSAGVLTVNGVSHHTDTLHIYVDDTAKGSVVDTNNQYAFSHINLNGTHPNDRLYMLKPGVATLLFPANNAVINYNNFDFDWTDVTGAVSYEFRNSLTNAVDGNGMLVTQHFGATSPISQLHSSGAPDGTVRYWQVRAVDANGVKGDWSSVWKMAIDMSTPVVPSATYTATPSGTTKTSGGYTNEKNFKFTLSSSADIVRYQLKYWNDIPGSPFKEASPWNPANLSGYQAGQGLNAYVDQFTQGEGKHYFAFSACDAAGNCSAYSTPFVITYDKTIPDTAITGATVLGNTLSFEGSVSDLHLNYYYCYLTTNQTIVVDGHTFTPGQEVRLNGNADSSRNSACNTTWASGATSFTGVVGGFTIPGVPDGDYTINLVARDLAGNNNAGSPAQYVLTLDRTAPNVTVNPIADSTNTTPTITGTVDADAVSVKVSLDEGVTWNDAVIDGTTWTFAVTSPLAVRTHTVIAIATDAAGNTSSSDILTPQPYWTQFAVNEPPVVTVQQGAGTPVPAAVVVAPQDTTPDAEIDTADDADSNVSAAGDSDSSNEVSTLSDQDSQKSWSLVNALLTAGIVLGSIMALVGAFGKKQDKDAKSNRVVGLITLIPAIGAAILFFAVEDLSAKMVWLNTWTILVTIIAVLQVALVAKARDNE